MRINLIVEQHKEDAWERAFDGLRTVSEQQAMSAGRYIEDSDSEGQRRIQQTRFSASDEGPYWTGMVPFRSGNSTALVGSPDDVFNALCEYVDAGISEFIFSSYPHDSTVSLIGTEVLPRLRTYFDSQTA